MKKLLLSSVVLLSTMFITACTQKQETGSAKDGDIEMTTSSTSKEESSSSSSTSSSTSSTSSDSKADVKSKTTTSQQAGVSREFRNALQTAQDYLKGQSFSKQGLYDQLTSEYGEKFPPEAAQYAIDNLKVDWNEQALKTAKEYLETMPMSNEELRNQLTSDYGEKFTPEEAQYALDHLGN